MLKLPDFLPNTLLKVARRLDLPGGTTLFALGDPVVDLHWIIRGELLAMRRSASGQDSVMMRGRAGEFFAEASLFTPNYTCAGVVRTPALLLALPVSALRQALTGDQQLSEMFLRAVVMNLRRQCSRVERLRLNGSADRIAHYLSCESAADGWCRLELPLSQWAADLGIEPETLYRTLASLEKAGKLERDGRRLRLLG